MYKRQSVDQSDIAAIELGESAVVEIADQGTFRGTVSKINPVSQSGSKSSIYYSVTIEPVSYTHLFAHESSSIIPFHRILCCYSYSNRCYVRMQDKLVREGKVWYNKRQRQSREYFAGLCPSHYQSQSFLGLADALLPAFTRLRQEINHMTSRHELKILPGTPYPMGVSLTNDGKVNFAAALHTLSLIHS